MQEGQTIAAHAVRAELRSILASPDFDASERNRSFLAHVVEETLAGRCGESRPTTSPPRSSAATSASIRSSTRSFGSRPDGCGGRSSATTSPAAATTPNDTTILAEVGQRYAMLGEWDKAAPLIAESYARNPAQPGTYRIGMFLYHYAHGRYEQALAEARRVEAPHVLYGHVAVAAAAARLGRRDEAAAAIAAILAVDPAYGEHAVADLEGRSLAPELIRAVVDGLADAGLPGLRAARAPTTAPERRAST